MIVLGKKELSWKSSRPTDGWTDRRERETRDEGQGRNGSIDPTLGERGIHTINRRFIVDTVNKKRLCTIEFYLMKN